MKKAEFLSELESRLRGLPQEDITRLKAYYGEMIDDRTEDGMSEEEATEALGSVDEVVKQVLAETPITKLVKERVKDRRKLRAWEIVLLVLGAPLWIPLMIVAFVLVLVFFILLWVVVIVLAALLISFFAAGVCGIVAAVYYFISGAAAPGLCLIGASAACFGLAVLMVPAVAYTAKGTAKLCKKIVVGIKSLFVGKEKV